MQKYDPFLLSHNFGEIDFKDELGHALNIAFGDAPLEDYVRNSDPQNLDSLSTQDLLVAFEESWKNSQECISNAASESKSPMFFTN